MQALSRHTLRTFAAWILFLGSTLLGATEFGPSDPERVGPSQVTQGKVTWSIGHLKVEFSGTWAPLLRGKATVGMMLEGNGVMEYTSAFPPERPALTANLKAWASSEPIKTPAGLAVWRPFKEARIYVGGTPMPVWEGSAGNPLDKVHGHFSQIWDDIEGLAPTHLVAFQIFSAPTKAVAVVQTQNGDERWMGTFDSAHTMEERLQLLLTRRRLSAGGTPRFPDLLVPVSVSRQPVGWDPRTGAAAPPFILSGLDVDLRTKDNRNAEFVVKETLIPMNGNMQIFLFNLWNTIRTTEDTRTLKMKSIKDASGQELPFDHSRDKLAVWLPAPAAAGKPILLRMEYSGDILVQPGKDNYWELGVRDYWYPTPELLTAESYAFHGMVRTMGDWLAFMPGETVRREKEGEWNLVETLTTKPVCFATILGGKYHLDEQTQDGLTVRIATYGFKPGVANKTFKAQAFNVINYYSRFLGPFPFKEFTIIQRKGWGWGQAPPGMMYISRDAFEQAMESVRLGEIADLLTAYGWKASLKGMDVRHTFAHEIAHQYWGTVVKMPSQWEQWITESFADYCAALFERDYKNKGYYDKNVAEWKAWAEKATNKVPIPLANELIETEGRERFETHYGLLYAKGPLLLKAIHDDLGDQMFLTWLKSAQASFRWKFATTNHLFGLLKFITKKDFQPMCDKYYWGMEMPPVK